eukprot:2815721-Lingulodinium_polyedra.AAC.1
MRAPENWRARGTRERAISEPPRRRTAIATDHCVTFCKRCTMMLSNRPFAAATARESHASHTRCEHRNW